jgi:hypothetical protein
VVLTADGYDVSQGAISGYANIELATLEKTKQRQFSEVGLPSEREVLFLTNHTQNYSQLLTVDAKTFDVISATELSHPALCLYLVQESEAPFLIIGERDCVEVFCLKDMEIVCSVPTFSQVNKIRKVNETFLCLGEAYGKLEFLNVKTKETVMKVQIKSTLGFDLSLMDNHISDLLLSLCNDLSVATNNGLFLLKLNENTSETIALAEDVDHHLPN